MKLGEATGYYIAKILGVWSAAPPLPSP